jgi:hypothetical protein
MIECGAYQTLKICRTSDHGLYLDDGQGNQVLLPSKFVTPDMRIGGRLRVFLYTDSEDRPVATTQEPLATDGEIALLRVKDVNQVGAFLDWGLDKDLLLPFKEQLHPLQSGDEALVRVRRDKASGRVVATARLLKGVKPVPETLPFGHSFEAVVIDMTDIGFRVLLDGQHQGILYRSDVHERLGVGDRRTVYLNKVRSDGRADVLMQKPGYQNAIQDVTSVLENVLRQNRGEVKITAQTPPAEIERVFKMSKKTFKKALGALYKERKVEILEDRIRLTDHEKSG